MTPPTPPTPIKLRPYQIRAVTALVSVRAGITKAPAGSGKTIIAAAAIDERVRRSPKALPRILWLANTQDQLQQAKKAVAQFQELASRGIIYYACYASGTPCVGFDLVLCDEVHHVPAAMTRKCLDGFSGLRWGLSATPERPDDIAADVFSLIGPIVCEITREEVLATGNLTPGRVVFHSPNEPSEIEDEVEALAAPLIDRMRWMKLDHATIQSRAIWQACQSPGITENLKRNDAIVTLAREHALDSVLLLVGSIEHGMALAARIPGSQLVHAGIGKKRRTAALDAFRAGSVRCLIATSLADEGLDTPIANVLILAAAGRSATKSIQRTGRVLRPFPGKTEGLIHDFCDNQHGMLASQSRARRRKYEDLGYAIQDSAA